MGSVPNASASKRVISCAEQHSARAGKNADLCACFHAADVYVKFWDGSLKRPDISVFCRQPDEETEAVTLLPEAVVEIISSGYETKDLTVGVPFYLKMGVKDVLVLDPVSGQVRHFRPAAPEQTYQSPHPLVLVCGCEITV